MLLLGKIHFSSSSFETADWVGYDSSHEREANNFFLLASLTKYLANIKRSSQRTKSSASSGFSALSLFAIHKHALWIVGYSQQHHSGSVTLPRKLPGGMSQNLLFSLLVEVCFVWYCLVSNTYVWHTCMRKPRIAPAPAKVFLAKQRWPFEHKIPANSWNNFCLSPIICLHLWC